MKSQFYPINKNIITRFAPTPSGYLHAGNVFNFILIWALARRNQGVIHLRIDDIDTNRTRINYVENIFKVIDDIGISYDFGPKSVDDYLKNYRQETKKDYYRTKLNQLIDNGLDTYVCECSRSQIVERGVETNNYDGFCKQKQIKLSNSNALRVNTFNSLTKMKDFIVWQKFDIPAYQLTSIIDDIDMKINLIIRGEDLKESSLAQLYLAKFFNVNFESNVMIRHHCLIHNEDGMKLSKSQNDLAFDLKQLPFIINKVAQELNLSPEIYTLNELLR